MGEFMKIHELDDQARNSDGNTIQFRFISCTMPRNRIPDEAMRSSDYLVPSRLHRLVRQQAQNDVTAIWYLSGPNFYEPSRIIQRFDFDAVLVLPLTVALLLIPLLDSVERGSSQLHWLQLQRLVS